jgi:large subunit ribosomal protein L25
MAEIKLKARTRQPGHKQTVKKLRAEGKVLGNVYGKEIDPIAIELDAKDVFLLMHGKHAASLESVIVSLEIEDKAEEGPRPTLITEIQQHPIKQNILHIDFHQVSLQEKIHARIPVVTVGEAPGLSSGGILEHALRELDVECLAMNLPEEALVDISQLSLGAAIHVRDVNLGEGVTILNDPDLSIVSVAVPRAVVEVTEEAAAEAITEPEVIGEKAAEEETGEEGAERE